MQVAAQRRGAARRRHRPRARAVPLPPEGIHRRHHPPRRPQPDRHRRARGACARHQARPRRLLRLRPRRGRSARWRRKSSSTRRRSAPASATRSRRCWSTAPRRHVRCPSCCCKLEAKAASKFAATKPCSRPPPASTSIPRPRPTGRPSTSTSRSPCAWSTASTARSITSPSTARKHSDCIVTEDTAGRGALPQRGRFRHGLLERLHPLHRRRRIRLRRGNRHQHRQAPRPRAHGPRGTDLLQVHHPRQRPSPALILKR